MLRKMAAAWLIASLVSFPSNAAVVVFDETIDLSNASTTPGTLFGSKWIGWPIVNEGDTVEITANFVDGQAMRVNGQGSVWLGLSSVGSASISDVRLTFFGLSTNYDFPNPRTWSSLGSGGFMGLAVHVNEPGSFFQFLGYHLTFTVQALRDPFIQNVYLRGFNAQRVDIRQAPPPNPVPGPASLPLLLASLVLLWGRKAGACGRSLMRCRE